MKGLAITSRGLEETASMEIKELIGAECKIKESCVVFDFKKFEELCLLCYKAQSIDRILYLIGEFEFTDFSREFDIFFDKVNLNEWLEKHKIFKVECIRLGTHNFKSTDAEAKAVQALLKRYRKDIKFHLREHEIIFFIYINSFVAEFYFNSFI